MVPTEEDNRRLRRIVWGLAATLTASSILVWIMTSPGGLLNFTPGDETQTSSPTSSATSMGTGGPFRVVHVADGDTLTIDTGHHTETVRLIGVDTPEVKKPDTPVQCFGPEASTFTRRALLNKDVWVESDPVAGDRDRYGRLLRYVRTSADTADGRALFNLTLIRDGYAREYDYQHQNYKYRSLFQNAQTAAQNTGEGLWQACTTTKNGPS